MDPIFEKEQEILMNGLQTIALLSKLEVNHAKGVKLFDTRGKEYMDFFGGVGVCSIGHSHPKYIQAVNEQLQRSVTGSFSTEIRLRYLQLLSTVLPKELARVQFYTGGAEAVEAAIRLARSCTGRTEVVGFWGGYHGKTAQTMALAEEKSKKGYPSVVTGVYSLPYADCFHCPFDRTYPDCAMFCADFFEMALQVMTSGDVAAIILEPIQGTAGNVVPPVEFVTSVVEIARKHGALVIFDEVITGFGRTGHMFGMDKYDVVPDIVVFGKGIAAGFPLSIVVARDQVTHIGPFAQPSGSSSSYGGNPLGCAAGYATLEVILNEGLVDNARVVGNLIVERLECMRSKHLCISNVQGEGLMIGVECVLANGQVMPRERMTEFFRKCITEGLVAMSYVPRIRLYPPLCITAKEAMDGLDIFEKCLDVLDW